MTKEKFENLRTLFEYKDLLESKKTFLNDLFLKQMKTTESIILSGFALYFSDEYKDETTSITMDCFELEKYENFKNFVNEIYVQFSKFIENEYKKVSQEIEKL